MNILELRMLVRDGWVVLEKKEDEYSFNDIKVEINQDNRILITGDETEVFKIECVFENRYFSDALILGDAWERAYADLKWEKSRAEKTYPWYFAAYENGQTFCFGVKTLPNALCSWQCDNDKITLNIDIRNGSESLKLHGRTLDACQVITKTYQWDSFDAVCDFCKQMCDNPRKVTRPIFGGNDWYCCYGENSYEKIVKHAERVAECAMGLEYKPYMVIDDGWEICHIDHGEGDNQFNGGPWRYCNSNFVDMEKTADAIKEAGAIPGIWFRPLFTMEKFPEKYYLKCDGIKRTLDPSVPEVLEQIKGDVLCIKNWGYKLIKHDFSTFDILGRWGFELDKAEEIIFYDKTKTTAEIIKELYMAIREAAGDDVLIMGCNTMSHLSAGIMDIQRTGDDTSGRDWERTKKYGVNTLAFRMPQHNSFYLADADCVGITAEVEWEQNKKWLDVLAKSGTPLFVSIAEDAYNDEIKQAIKQAFKENSRAKQVSKPIDWMEKMLPEKWQSFYGTDMYDWDK